METIIKHREMKTTGTVFIFISFIQNFRTLSAFGKLNEFFKDKLVQYTMTNN